MIKYILLNRLLFFWSVYIKNIAESCPKIWGVFAKKEPLKTNFRKKCQAFQVSPYDSMSLGCHIKAMSISEDIGTLTNFSCGTIINGFWDPLKLCL